MKVIFLDIDGVLCLGFDGEDFESYGLYGGSGNLYNRLAQKPLKLFEQFLRDNPDVKIILSSAWRISDQSCKSLMLQSPLIWDRIIDKTPNMGARGSEIWMSLRKYPEITDFVILDDSGWDIWPFFGPENFIELNPKFGIVEDTISEMYNILNIDNLKVSGYND